MSEMSRREPPQPNHAAIQKGKKTANLIPLVAGSRASGHESLPPETAGLESQLIGASTRPPFDFVRITQSRGMLNLTKRESFLSNAKIIVIFFLWGFAYGIINTSYWNFQKAQGYSPKMALGMHATYFGGYLFGPVLVALPILESFGFRIALMSGLAISTFGVLLFWPAAVLVSLAGLLVASFISGLGISVLATTVNLFVALCGPTQNSEIRLNIARAIQATGWTSSSILSLKVLFKHVDITSALISMQWVFLILSIVSILLTTACYFLKLPELSSRELRARLPQSSNCETVCGVRVVWVTLLLGVVTQFCNVGGQAAFQNNFNFFVTFNKTR
jgi:fucose permease